MNPQRIVFPLLFLLLLLSPLRANELEKSVFNLSPLAGAKILTGWSPIELFQSPTHLETAVILLKKEDEIAITYHSQLLIQDKIVDYQFNWTGDDNIFLLQIQLANNKFAYITAHINSPYYDKIYAYPPVKNQFSTLVLESGTNFTLFDGKIYTPLPEAQSVEILIRSQEQNLYKINYSDKTIRLLENSLLSEPLADILDYGLAPSGKIRYLVKTTNHQFYYKTNQLVSKIFDNPNMEKQDFYSHATKESTPAYALNDGLSWWLYHLGEMLGPFTSAPRAIQRFTNDELFFAQYNPQTGEWAWIKGDLEITKSEFFNFEQHDYISNEEHFAIVRKWKGEFQVYADFEVILTLKEKPTCTFVDSDLLKIEHERATPFYGLYQFSAKRIYTEGMPIDIKIFDDDYFDFWMKKPGGWTAYREGIPVGQVKTDKDEEIMAFIINNSLFFPVWDNRDRLILRGEGGTLGPFKSFSPLERPERRKSDSRLYSSLIGETSDGITAIYGDSIVGPADSIAPKFSKVNPYHVEGLIVKFADVTYFFTIEKGMMLYKGEDN